MSPAALISQQALPGASVREWTYVAEVYLYEEQTFQAVVETATGLVPATTERQDEQRFTVRAECLDVFSQPSARATVSTEGYDVTFDQPAEPHIVISEPCPLDRGAQATIGQHFTNFLTMMAGAPSPRIAVSYRYGSPAVTLPVVLVPAADDDSSLAGMMAGAFVQWFQMTRPSTANAQIAISFSTPALTIADATIDLANVTDLS